MVLRPELPTLTSSFRGQEARKVILYAFGCWIHLMAPENLANDKSAPGTLVYSSHDQL